MKAPILQQCKLVVVRGKEKGREVTVAADVIRVGKAPDNDLVLDDETVSRMHFELVRDFKGWLVRDLRSTNGTFLDGAEIREAYVRGGSVISAGAVQVRVVPSAERVDVETFEGEALGPMIGRSPPMRAAFAVLARVAPTESAVLLEGEPGTGKALAALTVHELSKRRAAQFVTVDARGPSKQVEQELFKAGVLDRGGTVFLVEPAELSAETQARLTAVLDARELKRAGRAVKLDVRLLAATARDAAVDVAKGKLSADLRARLAAVTVRLPPLRERAGDLPLLVPHFLGEEDASIDLGALEAHDWPGNLDELRSILVVGRALARAGDGPGFEPGDPYRVHKERHTDDFERRYLTWLMGRAGGNISRAAREADMDRKFLHKLLKKHGLGV